MTKPATGQQPSLRPPRTEPGPPPAPANPITYEVLQCRLTLGRGLTVDTAPEHTKINVGMMASTHLGIRYVDGDRIRFAEQVEYEITGYDPTDATLTLHLVHDWRPGQKDDPTPDPDPEAEPTSDLDVTPFLTVHRYRRDKGDMAWLYRCWGDAGCDGFLSLDWSARDTAEREARAHLAGHPAAPAVKEG